MNTVIRKHEELLEVYERLGMLDMLEKERASTYAFAHTTDIARNVTNQSPCS